MVSGIFGADFSDFEAKVAQAIESLRAMEANGAKSMQGLTASTKQLDNAQSDMVGTLKSVAGILGIATSGAALAAYATSVAQFAGEIDNLSKKSGLSTDALQALGAAGASVGVDMATVAQAAGNLSKQLGADDSGVRGAIVGLGLDYQDLKASSPDEQLMQTMDALRRVEDQTTQAALAQQLYGKAGADMLTIIRDHTGSLDELIEKLRAAGLLIGEDQVKALSAAEAQWGKFTLQLKVFSAEVLTNMVAAGTYLKDLYQFMQTPLDFVWPQEVAKTTPVIEESITTAEVFQRRLQDLKNQAMDPLTESQKAQIREGNALKLSHEDIAKGVDTNRYAVDRLIAADAEAAASKKAQRAETERLQKAAEAAAKQQREADDKRLAQIAELTVAGDGWTYVVDRMNAKTLESTKTLLEHGVSQKTLIDVYKMSELEVRAVAAAVDYEKKARADLVKQAESNLTRIDAFVQAEIAAKVANAGATNTELSALDKYNIAHQKLMDTGGKFGLYKEQEIQLTNAYAQSLYDEAVAQDEAYQAMLKANDARKAEIESRKEVAKAMTLQFNNPMNVNEGQAAFGGGFDTDPFIRSLLQQGYSLGEALAVKGGYGQGILGGGGAAGEAQRTARAQQLRASYASQQPNVNVNMNGVLLSNDPSSRAQMMDLINSSVMDALRGSGVRMGTA